METSKKNELSCVLSCGLSCDCHVHCHVNNCEICGNGFGSVARARPWHLNSRTWNFVCLCAGLFECFRGGNVKLSVIHNHTKVVCELGFWPATHDAADSFPFGFMLSNAMPSSQVSGKSPRQRTPPISTLSPLRPRAPSIVVVATLRTGPVANFTCNSASLPLVLWREN